jgi:hypothetical protein
MRSLPGVLGPLVIPFIAGFALVACGRQTAPAPTPPSTVGPAPTRHGHVAPNGVTGHWLELLGESQSNSLTVAVTWADSGADLRLALVGGTNHSGIPPTYGRYVAAEATERTGTTRRLVYAPTDPRVRLVAGVGMLIWITNASASPQDYVVEVGGVAANIEAAEPDVHTYVDDGGGNLCKAMTCRYLASSGFSGPVSFSCPDAAAGVTCLFTEQSVMPIESQIREIGLSVVLDPRLPATLPPPLLTIRATGAGIVRDWRTALTYSPPALAAPGSDQMRVTGCVLRENFDNLSTPIAADVSAQVVGIDGGIRDCTPVRTDYWGFFVFPFGASGCPATAGDRIRLAVRGRSAAGDTPYEAGQWINTALR